MQMSVRSQLIPLTATLLFSIIFTSIIAFLVVETQQQKAPQDSNRVEMNQTLPMIPVQDQDESYDTKEFVTLLFGGDMMFDRHIRQKAEGAGSYSALIEEIIALSADYDGLIANLEGPITDERSISVGSAVGSTANYIFTFPPDTLAALRDLNTLAVNLGNNHITNFGPAGLASTAAYLESAGIEYFGVTNVASTPEQRTTVLEINSIRIGFSNYNQFIDPDPQSVLEDLKYLQALSDYQVIYTHWGNEYQQETPAMKLLAQEWVTAGADAIIGSHPHVIAGSEVMNSRPVYYSLGNFIFDQYFEPAVKKGLLVAVTFPKEETVPITTQEFPIEMFSDGTTRLSSTTTATASASATSAGSSSR